MNIIPYFTKYCTIPTKGSNDVQNGTIHILKQNIFGAYALSGGPLKKRLKN